LQIRFKDQTTSGPKYDVHTKFHRDLTCGYDIMVSAQCTAARLLKNDLYPHVYEGGGLFSIIIQPTFTKFGGHIER